ncbi:MAG: alpha/beta hydrolase, partial [Verrucomicrobiales bacterium]|nr:alpha/beta hydrolase [Verrucomicrobiales bacterium]
MMPKNTDCTLLNHRLYPVESGTVPCWIAIFSSLFLISLSPAQEGQKKKHPPLPEGVEVIRDIEYANIEGESLTLDVYRPFDWADYDNTPVVIWVHGGGWKNGSKDRCPAAYLAQDNLSVVSINYRLLDKAQWPAQINDCYEAVRWVRKNAKTYGFGEKVGAWGGSAGGHLVALMGTRPYDGEEEVSSKVQAVCDFYGPSDLLTMPPNMIANGRTREDVEKSNGALLLGKTVMDAPDLAKDASALHQVSEGHAPFLIMHGAE